MTPLESLIFVCIPFLQFEAGFSAYLYYISSGQKAILPCESVLCNPSTVQWFHVRQAVSETLASKRQASSQAAKLTLYANCSLGIENIRAEDAGRYICHPSVSFDIDVYVSVLTVSPISTDADLERDETITLKCSLENNGGYPPCQQNGLRWVNETGSVLTGTGDWYQVYGQTNCASHLKVKHQTGRNRKYTCKFFNKNTNREISAHYTPLFSSKRRDNHQETSTSDSAHPTVKTIIIISVVVGVTVLLAIAAVLIKNRFWKKVKEIVKETKGVQHLSNSTADPESNLTYATLSHQNTRATKKVVREEAVTYSAIKRQMKTEADVDPVYSNVNK